jgi:hypothetical protein
MFFPAAGCRLDGNTAVGYVGSRGFYWSSTANAHARNLSVGFMGSTNILGVSTNARYFGFMVRCVRN